MKATSGIQGLEEAQHNLGCLEPDNLTVDTRRLGASLRQRLEDRGVTFVMGREGRLVTQGARVVGVALGGGDRLEADRSLVVGRGSDCSWPGMWCVQGMAAAVCWHPWGSGSWWSL